MLHCLINKYTTIIKHFIFTENFVKYDRLCALNIANLFIKLIKLKEKVLNYFKLKEFIFISKLIISFRRKIVE